MTGQATTATNKGYWEHVERWVPVIYPAVIKDSYEIDEDLLASRVSVLAKAAFTMLVAAIPMSILCPIGSVVLISMAIVAHALPQIDTWAAERALDVKAVNEFLQEDRPSVEALRRITGSLGAAQRFVQKKGDFNKAAGIGYTVSSFATGTDFDVFKCLVDGGMKLDVSAFERIVKMSDSRFLDYVLTQKKASVADFTKDEQVTFWELLGNEQAGFILARNGFDVNVRNSRGWTPLLSAASGYCTHYMCRVALVKTLLRCGANKSLTTSITGEAPKSALELTNDPKVREALEKTVQEMPVAKRSCERFFRSVPVIYPALKQSSCVIDRSLLAYRVAAVAKISFALLALAIPMTLISPLGALGLVALSALSHALPRLDSWRAERAADVKAVDEYMQMEHPTAAARERILANPKLLQLLVKQKGDLNKVDQKGGLFSDALRGLDFDTFKCLVDGGMNIKNVSMQAISLFEAILCLKDPQFLDYVLTQNKVKASDFSATEQYNLWNRCLGNKKAGDLLKRHGFDVDSRNGHGYTLLMRAADLHDVGHVKALLDWGADKSLTISVPDGTRFNPKRMSPRKAIDFAISPRVKELLA